MHSMGGVIDMRRFGGLRKVMPITAITFLCGSLALAGVAPFAGFFSKDEILTALRTKGWPDAAPFVARITCHEWTDRSTHASDEQC